MSLFVVGPDRVFVIDTLVKSRWDDSRRSGLTISLLH